MKSKGFTLIELMIVVAIIAILAAVAAPKFGEQLKKAKDSKGVEVASVWSSAVRTYYSDATTYPTVMLDLVKFVDDNTLTMTYDSDASGTLYDSTNTTATGAAVQVGTGVLGTDNKSYSIFSIVGTATESSLQFINTEKDTKGTTWSAIKI